MPEATSRMRNSLLTTCWQLLGEWKLCLPNASRQIAHTHKLSHAWGGRRVSMRDVYTHTHTHICAHTYSSIQLCTHLRLIWSLRLANWHAAVWHGDFVCKYLPKCLLIWLKLLSLTLPHSLPPFLLVATWQLAKAIRRQLAASHN